MPKFEYGDWVQPSKGKRTRGIVKATRSQNVLVRWLGSTRATESHVRSLRKVKPPRALVLEGILDDQLHSTRSEEDLLRTWLKANDVELAYKNIYSLDDIGILGKAIGVNKPLFVHISCHGGQENGRAYLKFAPGGKKTYKFLSDEDTIDAFAESFAGIPILFSACEIGCDANGLSHFAKHAGIPCVAAFTRVIYDREAMMFELMVYHGAYVNGWNFETAVNKAREALHHLNIKADAGERRPIVKVFKRN